jgi:hypothetical protein
MQTGICPDARRAVLAETRAHIAQLLAGLAAARA